MVLNNYAVSISGGNHRGDRKADDFYATPRECTETFLHYEKEYLRGLRILEPCCGDGAISKVFEQEGHEVVSTDLVYRGYGEGGKDFLALDHTSCNALVTNPPFNISEEIIRHALERLRMPYMALLLKSQYWHAKKRAALFEQHPPAIIYAMTWRPDFLGKGSSTMDCQWVVWRQHEGATAYQPMIKKPLGDDLHSGSVQECPSRS